MLDGNGSLNKDIVEDRKLTGAEPDASDQAPQV